jgi:hypothetical protein
MKSKTKKYPPFFGSIGYHCGIAVKAEDICPILPKARRAETRRAAAASPALDAVAAEAHEKYFAELPS